MTDFVNVQVTTDPTTLLDSAIDAVNANLAANGFPNWSPSDANLAVITMGVIAQWAADIGVTEATATAAIFRAFGTQLCGIPYIQGSYATVTSTWTFTSAAPSGGYTIPAGTGVLVGGSAFYVQTTVVTATSATTATVVLVASALGAAFNGLGGVNATVDPVDELDWVASIVTTGSTAGGADQETDDDYQNRLAAILQLQAPRPITADDYAAMVLSLLCVIQTGIVVGRATAIDGWYPAPRALTTGGAGPTALNCTIVSSSTSVTINSGLSANTVPQIGATVTGSNITGGTTVAASPAPTPTSFSLSAAATGSATESVTVAALSGYGPVELTGTGTVSSSATTVTAVTGPYVGSIPAVGALVTGTAIPANDTVAASPAPTATTFSLAVAATGSHTAETLTVSEWTTIARCVTTFVTDADGNALSTADMDALQTWLNGFREANFFEAFIQPPSYTTIYVTAEIHVLPGYSSAAVVTNATSAVLAFLSPESYGNPTGATTGASSWLNYTQGFSVVRLNTIIGLLEQTPGVQYAVNGQVFLGTSPSPGGTSDIQLAGPAPLPLADDTTVLITAV